jgi:hypothetical protein
VNDIDILDKLFDYLYKNGSCDNIKDALEQAGDSLVSNDIHRAWKLIISTGFVKDLPFSYSSHRAFQLNEQGYQMMLKHGSYSDFIQFRKKEKERVSEEKWMERKNLELEIEKKVIERKYKPLEILFAVIGGICTLIVLIEGIIKLISLLK